MAISVEAERQLAAQLLLDVVAILFGLFAANGGIFALKDEQGQNVPYQQVQRWVVENSRLPDISFWIDRVFHGVLASVTVSEREQGLAAGRLARSILVDGAAPGSLPMTPTVKGHPVINLSRAEQLGINVRSSLLLSSEVVRGFQWANPA